MEHQHMKKTSFTTQELVFTALMTALVFVATYLPHIPIPLGYAHLGDAVIFLLALLTPRRSALVAACIGSALADLLGGFAIWIVPTLVIKFVMAEIVYRIGRRGDAIAPRASVIAALLLSSIWMAAAYTLAGVRRTCLHAGTYHGGDCQRYHRLFPPAAFTGEIPAVLMG